MISPLPGDEQLQVLGLDAQSRPPTSDQRFPAPTSNGIEPQVTA